MTQILDWIGAFAVYLGGMTTGKVKASEQDRPRAVAEPTNAAASGDSKSEDAEMLRTAGKGYLISLIICLCPPLAILWMFFGGLLAIFARARD